MNSDNAFPYCVGMVVLDLAGQEFRLEVDEHVDYAKTYGLAVCPESAPIIAGMIHRDGGASFMDTIRVLPHDGDTVITLERRIAAGVTTFPSAIRIPSADLRYAYWVGCMALRGKLEVK